VIFETWVPRADVRPSLVLVFYLGPTRGRKHRVSENTCTLKACSAITLVSGVIVTVIVILGLGLGEILNVIEQPLKVAVR